MQVCESDIGGGFFAQLLGVLNFLIRLNMYDYKIDWNKNAFPYNDNNTNHYEENIFEKYFKVITNENLDRIVETYKLFPA